jgi:hypothetical protein
MIKTLRITSIIAAIAATILLIFPAVYGVRSNPQIEEFLKSPGVAEKFAAAKGQHPTKKDAETSPLVKQAADFGKILNPPPPPPPKVAPGATAQGAAPAPPVPVAAKFDLIATSYFASRPEQSFVLIDEVGKGLHWVKQGATVGRVTIETIKDGTIIVRDGQRTSEMNVKVQETWRNLLKNPPPQTRPGSVSTNPAGSAAATATANPGLENPVQPSPVTTDKPGLSNPARMATSPTPGRRTPRGAVMPPASERITSGAQPAPPPAPQQDATPEATATPAVELSPLEKEIQAKIDKLTAEMESSKDSKETTEKMNEIGKLFEQLEKINSSEHSAGPQPKSSNQPDVNAPNITTDINK